MKRIFLLHIVILTTSLYLWAQHKYYIEYTSPSYNIYKFYSDAAYTKYLGTIDLGSTNEWCCHFTTTSRVSTLYYECSKSGSTYYGNVDLPNDCTQFDRYIKDWLSFDWQPDISISNPPVSDPVPYGNIISFNTLGGYQGNDIVWKFYNQAGQAFVYSGDTDRNLRITMDSARKYIEDFDDHFRYGNEYPFRLSATVRGFDYNEDEVCSITHTFHESGLSNTYYFDLVEISVINEDPEPTGEICDDEVTLLVEGSTLSSLDWYYNQWDSETNSWKWAEWKNIRYGAGTQVNISIEELEIDSAKTTYFRAHKQGVVYPASENLGIIFYPPAPEFTLMGTTASCTDEATGILEIDNIRPHVTDQLYQISNAEGYFDRQIVPADSNAGGWLHFENLPPSASYKVEAFNIIGTGNKKVPVCYAQESPIVVSLRDKPYISDTTSTTPNCVGWDDGSIQITGTDLNGNLFRTYLMENYTVTRTSGSYEITGLVKGEYQVFFEDASRCNSDTLTMHVSDPPPIRFLTDSVNPLCFGSSDGEIAVVNPHGGIHSNYIYSMDPAAGTLQDDKFIHLPSGNYKVKVALNDFIECYDTHTVILLDPEKLLMDDPPYTLPEKMASGYHITCAEGSDGEAMLHATGGTGDYTYHLRGSPDLDQQDPLLSGLSAQTYRGFVTDEHDCYSDTTLFTPLEPDPIVLSDVAYTREKCKYTGDGAIDITVNGGVSPYLYRWTIPDEPIRTTEDIDDITAGTYSVAVTDHLGCEQPFPGLTLEPPDTIEAVISSLPPVCRGEHTGTIHIESIEHGTPPYTCVIEKEAPEEISGLPVTSDNRAPGYYTLTIRDANYIENDDPYENCKSEFAVAVSEKDPVILNASVTDAPCNGDNGSIIMNSVSGPGNTNNYLFNWYDDENSIITASQDLDDQPAGDYRLEITDEENCDTSVFYTIDEPLPLSFTPAIITDASCEEVEDGSIEIQGAGGTPPYLYMLDGSGTYAAISEFGNLSADEHTVNLRDNHLCLHDTIITVGAGEVLVSVTEKGDVTCFGFNDGYLTLQADGGKGNYSYSSDNGSAYLSSHMITDLYAGTYYIIARDNETTCESEPVEQEINEPKALLLSPELVDSSACGLPLGEIAWTASGGSGDYEVTWTYNNTALNSTENLVTGDYEGTLRDMQSTEACSTVAVIHVPDRPSPEIAGHEVLTQTWCGKPLGEVTVNASGGSPPYTYLWDDDGNQTAPTASQLMAREYNVMVTDRYGCSDLYTFTLEDGPPIVVSHVTQDATCNQDNGIVYLSVNGGVKPYRFKWHDSLSLDPVNDSVMKNLYSGIYDVVVLDEIGCEQPYTLEVSDKDGPEIYNTLIHKSWCGLETGYAQISVDKGTVPYTYEWIPQGSSQSISSATWAENLAAGNYYARVIDVTGCVDIVSVAIADSAELEPGLELTAFDSSSCGKATGSMEVRMTGGLEPYVYAWDVAGENSLPQLSGITEGTYHVTVTDNRGCIKELQVDMTDKALPLLMIHDIIDAYCSKPTGQIRLKGRRGDAPYHVVPDENASESYPLDWTDSVSAYYGTADGLLPGIYHLVLFDSYGCSSETVPVQVQNFSPMQMDILQITPVNCYGGSDGYVAVEVTDGKEPYVYQWSSNSVNVSENSSLPAGEVSITVTDTEGCEVSENAMVTQPNPLTLAHSAVTDPVCHDMCNGSVEVGGTGGTGVKLYIWNQTDTTSRITGLCPGQHQMTMADENGCRAEFSFTLINPPVLVGVGLPEEEFICSGSVYTIELEDEWQHAVWTSGNDFYRTGNFIELSEAGTYYLEAESSEGCPVDDTITLYLSDDLLTADFLMASEAEEGEEVVLVEISWPVPDEVSWNFPEGISTNKGNDFVREIVFEEAGTYEITLSASLGNCRSTARRTIEIFEVIPGNEKSEDISHKLIKSFEVYPNPADNNFYVDAELDKESEVWIEILGTNGQYYRRKMEGTSTDNITTNVNISGYKSGIYIVRIIAGNEVESKIVVVH